MTEHDRPEPVKSSFPGESSETQDAPAESTASRPPSRGSEGLPPNGDQVNLPPMFEGQQSKEIRERWHDIQAAFVDDPHDAIRQAGALNDEIVSALTAALDARKQVLEQSIDKGDTEQLRVGMRQYRQMLDQIITL